MIWKCIIVCIIVFVGYMGLLRLLMLEKFLEAQAKSELFLTGRQMIIAYELKPDTYVHGEDFMIVWKRKYNVLDNKGKIIGSSGGYRISFTNFSEYRKWYKYITKASSETKVAQNTPEIVQQFLKELTQEKNAFMREHS